MTDPCCTIFKDKRLKWFLRRHADVPPAVEKQKRVSRTLEESLVVKRDYYGTLAPQIDICDMNLKIEIAMTSPSQKRISADTAHLFSPESSSAH